MKSLTLLYLFNLLKSSNMFSSQTRKYASCYYENSWCVYGIDKLLILYIEVYTRIWVLKSILYLFIHFI